MTTIKVLGTGCVTCKRLLADVKEMVLKNNWQAQVEYVTYLPSIISYGVMSTPALVMTRSYLLNRENFRHKQYRMQNLLD
jgi:hypothetical protein